MHINVSDILASELSANRTFIITDERPELEGITLIKPLSGEASIIKTETDLEFDADLACSTLLECHRCLKQYEHPLQLEIEADFATAPIPGEQWPITEDGDIDLDPVISDEILVQIPIRQSCGPN